MQSLLCVLESLLICNVNGCMPNAVNVPWILQKPPVWSDLTSLVDFTVILLAATGIPS